MTKKALIIGIDDYPNAPLRGCKNDAEKLEKVLSRNHDGSVNFQCEVLTSPATKLTRPIVRRKISELFSNNPDMVFLHFSGHGTSDGLGGYLVTPDYCPYDVGIPMTELLTIANESKINNVFITLDCCHSGNLGIVPAISNNKIVLSEGVSVITATRSGQEALEEAGNGVFTSLLVEALEGGASDLLGNVSAASIYAYIDAALGAWEQRPLFKSNVSRFVRLRMAKPKIDIAVLRKIKSYFPLPAEQLELSPTYEPTAEPHDTAKEEIFRDLLKLKYAGLVEPIGAQHMYEAAMSSRKCELTSLGRYYWRMVNENKL